MEECMFCKIIEGEIESDVVYEDDDFLAFRDIDPHAPIHILIIPKKHISSLNELEDETLAGKYLLIIKQIAQELGVSESGYRTVINCNSDAGQEVFHIHIHLLGGRKLNWPPG